MAKGLQDVVASTSAITFIDGAKGRLLYRGYDINQLAERSNYEEVAYLLWNKRLPTMDELRAFSAHLASKRPIPQGVADTIMGLPRDCDAMDTIEMAVAALGIYDDKSYTLEQKVRSISSKMATLVAQIHRHKHGLPALGPKEGGSLASNFLYMVTGEEPEPFSEKLMDVVLVLHADHELNASAFTARIVASTLSDAYSSVTAAVAALKGPLHGGANEWVVEMTAEIGAPENAERYIRERLANKEKIMGFGHRVYKTMDPRAKILKEYARRLVSTDDERKTFAILEKLEEIMVREKGLYPNVDLYSGLVLHHLGIPTYLFTPVFAVGRCSGWLAHVMEQYSDNRIMRPVAEYEGSMGEEYVPIEKRVGISD